jgi:hypothetical protein
MHLNSYKFIQEIIHSQISYIWAWGDSTTRDSMVEWLLYIYMYIWLVTLGLNFYRFFYRFALVFLWLNCFL